MKVCIFWEDNVFQQPWDYLLMALDISPEDTYLVVSPNSDAKAPAPSNRTGKANVIETVEDLPPGPLVVACPAHAQHLPGDVSLYTCIHPENAIYVFGADTTGLAPWMFGSRSISQKVYVPSREDTNLHSHVAAAMILYDRRCKHG